MARHRLTCVSTLIGLWCISAGATPVATTNLTSDLSNAVIDIGTGTFVGSSLIEANSYLHSETSGGIIDVKFLDNDGTISTTIPGVTANATVTGGKSANNTGSTATSGCVTAYSRTSTNMYFYAENVNKVSATFKISALMNLTIDDPSTDYAYGYWDGRFTLSYFNGNDYTNVDAFLTRSDLELFDGNVLSDELNQTITLSSSFGAAPFTGQFLVQSIWQGYSEAQAWEPSNVPEPACLSLMLVGLATLLPLTRFRKT